MNHFWKRKEWFYEVNKELVTNFQDESLHPYQCEDIVLFLRDVILEINAHEERITREIQRLEALSGKY